MRSVWFLCVCDLDGKEKYIGAIPTWKAMEIWLAKGQRRFYISSRSQQQGSGN